MYRGSSSKLVPVLIVLVVLALLVVALVSIGRAIFGGSGSPTPQTDTGRQALLSTGPEYGVRMTVRGPIVANENFSSYQVTVNPSSRTLTNFTGYLDQITGTTQLGNNTKAYEEFVYALDKANMMKGTPLSGGKDDTRGVCATGDVYEFEVLKANNSVKRLWTSTCRGSRGSLDASVTQLKNLFLSQLPSNNPVRTKISF